VCVCVCDGVGRAWCAMGVDARARTTDARGNGCRVWRVESEHPFERRRGERDEGWRGRCDVGV
jgi:hypothetical protein